MFNDDIILVLCISQLLKGYYKSGAIKPKIHVSYIIFIIRLKHDISLDKY